MKRFISFSFIIIAFIFILTGCNNDKKSPKAANLFNFDDKEVLVTLDLKDGWFVEFGVNGTYLYDRVPNKKTNAIAYGVYVSKDEYNSELVEYKKAKGFKKTKNGIFFKEDSLSKYIINVGDDIYYEVIVEKNNYNPDDVFKRFSIKLDNK